MKELTVKQIIDGLADQNRGVLSKAITLVESQLPRHNDLADDTINQIIPKSGKSIRIGITGVPGVGKSTFIESLGQEIIASNKKLAVLTIDPSSQKTRGSILGDKTRMPKLVGHPKAFIRPTPSGNELGGVAYRTQEAALLCEAAGFDVILIETVGVGQSEVKVREMVDFMLLLTLARTGDELQGIKKGIMEVVDGIVINKADGHDLKAANRTLMDLKNALHLFQTPESGLKVEVLTCSSIEHRGVKEVWQVIEGSLRSMRQSGYLQSLRSQQNLRWFESLLLESIQTLFRNHPSLQYKVLSCKERISNGQLHPKLAAKEITETLVIRE